MELFVDDAGFVRAPAWLVYRRLTDVASWSQWWPGVALRRAGTPADAARGRESREAWLIALRPTWRSAVRMRASFHGWRHDTGVVISLAGDVDGEAEFWLEPLGDTTVVHHLMVGRTALRPARRVHATYRRSVRQGLWGLKDALQLEMRTMAGLRP